MVSSTTPARVSTASPAHATPPALDYVLLHAASNHDTTQTLVHINSLETLLTTSTIPTVELDLMPLYKKTPFHSLDYSPISFGKCRFAD
jgi:hypothetical protein